MKKICIIKLGSSGDVLRTTPILREFSGSEISWITSKKSYPILKNNPSITNIFFIKDRFIPQKFDELYNFDEDEAACKIAEKIRSPLKKGFGWDGKTFRPFDKDSEYARRLAHDNELKFKSNRKTYQQIIFAMANKVYQGQDYVLNYRPNGRIKYPVGLNYMVGEKFPNKPWANWKILIKLMPEISLQRRFKTLKEYIGWINSCAIIVTADSLGMHIALALKKKVIALFGTTSMHEIEMYGRGIKLTAGLACSPCYKKEKCKIHPSCMESIGADEVYKIAQKMLSHKINL